MKERERFTRLHSYQQRGGVEFSYVYRKLTLETVFFKTYLVIYYHSSSSCDKRTTLTVVIYFSRIGH